MKRLWICFVIAFTILTGCQRESGEMQRVLSFRQSLLSADGCSFQARITADYGDNVYVFSVFCQSDKDGNLSFRVTEPEGIADITGTFHNGGGKLIFGDTVLAFPKLADGELTPVSGPWLLMQTLLRGYIGAVGTEGELLRATIHENYADNALQLDIWFDAAVKPVKAEILWQGRRVLAISVENFEIV